MMHNVGWRDAGVRAVVAAGLLLYSASQSPFRALAAGFLAIALLGTALYRVCPLYTVFGLNSASTKRPARPDAD
jgi:hypothetical protein